MTPRTRSKTSSVVFRIRGQLTDSNLLEVLERCCGPACKPQVLSFSSQADCKDQVATVIFQGTPEQLLVTDEKSFYDEDITIDSHFRGLTVLYQPDPSSHDLDIIAVCGLGGHAYESFREIQSDHIWICDNLKKDFPRARIITYGYDSQLHQSNSFQTLESIASSLRVSIEGIKASNPLRVVPIVFIAHSLGGLLVKEALIQSGLAKSTMYHRTIGALFFGVPNEGMEISSLLPMVRGQPNESFLHLLHPESELLRKQRRQFPEIFNSPATKIFCFYETQLSKTAKQVGTRWEMTGSPAILVGSSSATHCRFWENQAHHVQGLNRSHLDLIKFRPRDEDYYKVRNILEQVIATGTSPEQRLAAPSEDEQLTNRYLQDLFITSPEDEMNRIEEAKDKLLPDCYRWVMTDPQLRAWQADSQRRLLWLRGDPGKGKTMLIIALVRAFLTSWNGLHALTFFFCQNADPNLNSATAVLRGILWMLIHKNPSLGHYLHSEYKDRRETQLFDGPVAFVALRRILSNILKDTTLSTVYILIDALDECESEQKQLISFICENAADEKSRAKWLVSSRNHLNIEEIFSNNGSQILSLELNDAHILKSVESFIEHRVGRLAILKKYTKESQDLVRSHLLKKADSTFLWVALVCRRLEDVPAYQLGLELQRTPPGLAPLYDRMLEQVLKEDWRELTAAVIRRIILAKRPLLIGELRNLLDVPHDISSSEGNILDMVKLCGSFFTVRNQTIYLIHQSVKDYFTSGEGGRIFIHGMAQEHLKIVQICLKSLSGALKRNMCSLNPGDPPTCRNEGLPLGLSYASSFWIHHLDECHGVISEHPEMKEILSNHGDAHQFLLQHLLHWVELMALLEKLRTGITSLRRLEDIAKKGPSQNFYFFVQDAIRLILHCYLAVERAPLQIYTSALIFAPEDSPVRKNFLLRPPPWLESLPPVSSDWSPLQQTLEGHNDEVYSVAYSPDGKMLASGSRDKTLRIWDSATGTLLQTLKHSAPVHSVAYCPDGHGVISGTVDGTIRLWNIATESSTMFGNHNSLVTSTAFSPNGKYLASACADGTVKLWDATTRKLLHERQMHLKWISAILFSPNGRYLASASHDCTVNLWDLMTHDLLTLRVHKKFVFSLAFDSSGKRIATGAGDSLIRIWDTNTGKILLRLDCEESAAFSLTFYSNDRYLAVGTGPNRLDVWDIDTGTVVQRLEDHTANINSVVFSPDYEQLASASDDFTVRLWRMGMEISKRRLSPSRGEIRSLAFSPDGKQLASGLSDRTVCIWDAKSCLPPRLLQGHGGPIGTIAYDPSTRYLASGSDYGMIRIWNAKTGVPSCSLAGHKDGVYAISYSPDGSHLASASGDKTIRMWKMPKGRFVRALKGHKDDIASVAYSPNGKQLASGSFDQTVRLWDVKSGALQRVLQGHTNAIYSITFHPDGQQLASVDYDGEARIWDAAEGKLLKKLPDVSYSQSLQHLFKNYYSNSEPSFSFNKDNSWISINGKRYLWLPSNFRPAQSAVFGTQVAIGCYSGLVYVLEFNTKHLRGFEM